VEFILRPLGGQEIRSIQKLLGHKDEPNAKSAWSLDRALFALMEHGGIYCLKKL
jgi:hypothetical protein